MLKTVIENRLVAFLTIIVLICCYFGIAQFTQYYSNHSFQSFGLLGDFAFVNTFFSQFIAMGLVLLNAMVITYLFNSNNLYEKTTFFPGLIYVVWMSFSQNAFVFNGSIIAHFFLLLTVHQLFLLNQNEDGRARVFNTGLFFGLGIFFHPTLAIGAFFVFTMIWINRPFIIRETVLTITGMLVPILYAFAFSLIYKQPIEPWKNWSFQARFVDFQYATVSVVFISALLFFIITFLGVNVKLQKSSIRFRKQARMLWIFFFMLAFVALVDVIFTKELQQLSLVIIVLPLLSFFAFVKKPYAFFMQLLFVVVIIASLIKFFLK